MLREQLHHDEAKKKSYIEDGNGGKVLIWKGFLYKQINETLTQEYIP